MSTSEDDANNMQSSSSLALHHVADSTLSDSNRDDATERPITKPMFSYNSHIVLVQSRAVIPQELMLATTNQPLCLFWTR